MNPFPYQDIVSLPHPVSRKHTPMSLQNRAAQFSPFAALTGYDASVLEAARLTDARIDLDEMEISRLDARLQRLSELLPAHPQVTVCWYLPDARKAGGSYPEKTGLLKKIDPIEQQLLFADGTRIPMQDLREIRWKLPEEASSAPEIKKAP